MTKTPRGQRLRRVVRRPQARGIVTRDRILKAARELFARQGYAGTSRADIAKRAGVGMGTIYHHFPDMRDILLNLVDEWADTLRAQRTMTLNIERALAGEPRAAARDFLEAAYESLHKGKSVHRVILAEADRDPEVRRRYQRAQQTMIQWIQGLVEQGRRAGLMRETPNPAASSFLLHHAVNSLLIELAGSDLPESEAQDVLEEFTDMLCRYVLVEEHSTPRSAVTSDAS